jgi:hypothetical protein
VLPRRITSLAALAGLLILAWFYWPWRPIPRGPGILAPAEPVQTSISKVPLGTRDGFQIEGLAAYEITARVLRTKHYHSGPTSKLAPFDVAVAWGPMSDQAILDQLRITQGNRFFFYRWRNAPPLPAQQMISHAANMHVISANPRVASFVRWVRPGEVVKMRGYLVNVRGPNGFHWNSSLTRHDSGSGACELFYVQTAESIAVGAELPERANAPLASVRAGRAR